MAPVAADPPAKISAPPKRKSDEEPEGKTIKTQRVASGSTKPTAVTGKKTAPAANGADKKPRAKARC